MDDIGTLLKGTRELAGSTLIMLTHFEDAVEPILRPSVPKGETKAQSEPVSGSPLSQQIQDLAQVIEKIRRKVGNLTERVDFKPDSMSKESSE